MKQEEKQENEQEEQEEEQLDPDLVDSAHRVLHLRLDLQSGQSQEAVIFGCCNLSPVWSDSIMVEICSVCYKIEAKGSARPNLDP